MADEISVTPVLEQAPVASQPPAPVSLDDAAVRQAIADAEAQGKNPESLKVADLSQGSVAPAADAAKPTVPEKFLKPDGEVDVEKLKASTKQLDEAIQKKETEVQKTVDDYVTEYRAKEAKFRTLPNPQKLAEGLPTAPPQQAQPTMTPQELEARIAADWQRNPLQTTLDLINIAAEQKLQERLKPYEEDMTVSRQEREDKRIRQNLQEIVSKDSRVMHPTVFAAINAKLEAEPQLWNLKNPHKAAWLEVKEEMRLGEPNTVHAQPRTASPILGGGTPPPPPSVTGLNPQNPAASLSQFDLRDRKQEAEADALVRQMLERGER